MWPAGRAGDASSHHEASGEGHHVGDSVCGGAGLVQADVSEHGPVYQRPQQEVDVTQQHHAQTHLHQSLGLVQPGAAHTWGGEGQGAWEREIGINREVSWRQGPRFHFTSYKTWHFTF